MPPLSEIARLTHALLRPETAVAAAETLRGSTEPAAVEGLVELLAKPPSARAAIVAVNALEGCDSPLGLDALARALDSPHASVRAVVVQSLHRRKAAHVDDALTRLLNPDESWLVRRAALRTLADRAEPVCWRILDAADDPHWRVRHALILVLLEWGANAERRAEIERSLALRAQDPRVA
ncbi:MAG: HEAT repeat domain-containing protein, partial [Gemmataceae bacterium]|nr:HEAT repeat domain-containing protein [Gemmataceae bacterium]